MEDLGLNIHHIDIDMDMDMDIDIDIDIYIDIYIWYLCILGSLVYKNEGRIESKA